MVPALGQDRSIGTSGTAFTPATVTVDVGDTVTVSNTDGGFHDLHWDDRANAEQALPGPGWTSTRTFSAPGTYTFACDVHRGTGMTGTVVVRRPETSAPAATTDATATQTTPPAQQTTTTASPPPSETTTTPTPTTTSTAAPPATASTAASSADRRAPSLRARAGSLRGRLVLVLSLSERARVVAVVRYAGLRTTIRFVLVPGNRTRTLLRTARPGRYTITLTATDEAGNRSKPLRKVVRVVPR